MGRFSRDDIVGRLQAVRSTGGVVYDALCGTGITAKMAARGGADMVTTHVLAFFRMQGLSSMAGYLPIGDANAITLELGERYLRAVVTDCPVIAGVLCGDPTRDMRRFAHTLIDAGFDGVMNCPTVALIDGKFRSDLEDTGLGFEREVDILGYAHAEGIFTKAFCTTVDEAMAMAEVGVDNIIIHYGNSSGGSIGSKTVLDTQAMVERTATICDALADRFADRIITVHGGSIETPDDFAALVGREARIDGYVGGSSAERFPIEESVPKATQAFKSVPRGR